MGCSCSRDEILCLEEDYFTPFELSLQFHLKKASEIVSSLKISTISTYIHLASLEKIFENFALNFNQHLRFFRFFEESDNFISRKLSLTAILLARGSPNIKSNLLFDVADKNLESLLYSTDIELLINDLLTISCDIIPSYVSSLHLNNEKIKSFLANVRHVIRGTAVQMAEDFMGYWNSVTKEIFVQRLVSKYKILLNSKGMRKYCLEVYNWAIKPVQKVLDRRRGTEEIKEVKAGERLGPRISRNKRHKSNAF